MIRGLHRVFPNRNGKYDLDRPADMAQAISFAFRVGFDAQSAGIGEAMSGQTLREWCEEDCEELRYRKLHSRHLRAAFDMGRSCARAAQKAATGPYYATAEGCVLNTWDKTVVYERIEGIPAEEIAKALNILEADGTDADWSMVERYLFAKGVIKECRS